MSDDGDIIESQEILAGAVVYLMGSGKQDIADLLLSCKLEVQDVSTGYDRTYIVEVVGPNAIVDSMSKFDDVVRWPRVYGFDKDIRPESSIGLIRRSIALACPSVMRIMSYKLTITARAGIVSLAYREATRRLVEDAGMKLPTIGSVRVSDQGKEAALHPISIFPTGVYERKQSLCFVMMPFAPLFQPVYEQGIKPAVQSANLECRRGDDILQAGDILKQIWISLIQARIVIADLTGSNGNVLYELGIAHVIGHEAILLTQDINAIPFDLRHQRHIVYAASPEGLKTLSVQLAQAVTQTIGSLPKITG